MIDADRGGRLISLEFFGHQCIADAGARANEPDWYGGSFLLAPWAGQLPFGTHGVVYDKNWQVKEAGPHAVTLTIELNDAYWSGTLEQCFELSPEALSVRAIASPYRPSRTTLGFHPWFRRENDGLSPEIVAEFDHRIGADGSLLRVAEHGVSDYPRDEVYRGVDSAPMLRWRNGHTLKIESAAPVWVIYEADALGVCVEPWTGSAHDYLTAENTYDQKRALELSMTLRWSRSA